MTDQRPEKTTLRKALNMSEREARLIEEKFGVDADAELERDPEIEEWVANAREELSDLRATLSKFPDPGRPDDEA